MTPVPPLGGGQAGGSGRRHARRRARLLAIAAAVIMLAASCAPRRVALPELDLAGRRAAFQAALEARAARATGVDADLTVWLRAEGRDVAGVQARLVLAAPDAFRLRVASLFGTALDLSTHGDSLTAYVPARRAGMALDSAGDSLGVRDPGVLGVRAFGATWAPPESAWPSAVWAESLLRVRWREGEDSLDVAIGSNGLPVEAALTRRGGGGIIARYAAWSAWEGIAWPSRLAFADRSGAVEVECRVTRLRFGARPDRDRLAVALPPGAERITRAGLAVALRRLGTLP